jgi:hypothetical protein
VLEDIERKLMLFITIYWLSWKQKSWFQKHYFYFSAL